MANAYLIRLRDQFREEAKQLRERLAKLDKALEGMDAAIELAGDDPEDVGETSEQAEDNVMELIASEAFAYDGVIRPPEFTAFLMSKYPGRKFVKSTVSHALKKAADDGRLALLEKGQGKRPSSFRSVQASLDLGQADVPKVQVPLEEVEGNHAS